MIGRALLLATLVAAAPSAAEETVQLRLTATMPVECGVQLLAVTPALDGMRVSFLTRCNVDHVVELGISGPARQRVRAVDTDGRSYPVAADGRISLPGRGYAPTLRSVRLVHASPLTSHLDLLRVRQGSML